MALTAGAQLWLVRLESLSFEQLQQLCPTAALLHQLQDLQGFEMCCRFIRQKPLSWQSLQQCSALSLICAELPPYLQYIFYYYYFFLYSLATFTLISTSFSSMFLLRATCNLHVDASASTAQIYRYIWECVHWLLMQLVLRLPVVSVIIQAISQHPLRRTSITLDTFTLFLSDFSDYIL